jgi:hypothetical protein
MDNIDVTFAVERRATAYSLSRAESIPPTERDVRSGAQEHGQMSTIIGKLCPLINPWYKFTWNAEAIRESTMQKNKRVAEQIQAANKTETQIADLPLNTQRLEA